MKTLNVRRVAMLATRPETAATVSAAIERQIDEIQGTFGVRWEW